MVSKLRMLVFKLAVLYLVLVAVTAEDQCKQHSCTCDFDEDTVGGESPKSEAAKKSEVLAAAAGAMSPLLIGGAGLGIYKLVKSRGSNSMTFDRSASDLSETSANEPLPPKYTRRGSEQSENDVRFRKTSRGKRNMGEGSNRSLISNSNSTRVDHTNLVF